MALQQLERLSVRRATLIDVLEGHARSRPDHLAIATPGATVSWRELAGQVAALSGWLGGPGGVRAGDRVLICLPNGIACVTAYLAVIRAGGIAAMVGPKTPAGEIDRLVESCDPVLMIAGSPSEPGQQHHIPRLLVGEAHVTAPDVAWTDALNHGLPVPASASRWDEVCTILFSSGSSGVPKGCQLSMAALVSQVTSWSAWVGLNPSSTSLVTLPLFHVAGLQTGLNGSLLAGAAMVMPEAWDPAGLGVLIARHRPTHWISITTMITDLLDQDCGSIDFTSFRMIGGGGAAMPSEIAQRLLRITGHEYVEGYGLTEAAGAILVNPPGAPVRQCLGAALFNNEVLVVDPETGNPLPAGEVGEIVVAGPSLFSGYWNDEAASRAAFRVVPGRGQFLCTGDLGRADEAGLVFIVDRLKRMVNVAGEKVSPTEVEDILQGHPDVGAVCVIAGRDPRRGETVKAVVSPAAGRSPPTLEALQNLCRGRLASYKWPRLLAIVDELPRGPTGKVDWRALQDAEADS